MNHATPTEMSQAPRLRPVTSGESEKDDWFVLYTGLTFLSAGATGVFAILEPAFTVFYLANLLTQFYLVWLCVSLREKQTLAISKMILCLWFVANLLRGWELTGSDHMGDFRVYLYTLTPAELTSGALLVSLFTFAVAIGSHFRLGGTGQLIAALFRRVRFRRKMILPLALAIIVLCYFAVAFSTSEDSLSAKRVYESANGETTRFGPITFILIASMFYMLGLSYYLIEKGEKLFYILVCGAVITLIAFTISLRTYVLFFALPFILNFARRVSFRSALAFLALAPVMGIFVGYVTYERNHGNAFEELTIAESLAEAADAITLNANYGGFLSTTMSTVAIEGQMPVLYGRTFVVDPVMQFVPRNFWPNKPEELGGELRPYQQDVGILPYNIVGGVPPGIVAEAWLNGRIVGLILFGLFFGMLLQGFAAYRNRVQSLELRAAFSVVAVAIVFFWFGGHFARLVMSIVQFGVAAAFVTGVHWAFSGLRR